MDLIQEVKLWFLTIFSWKTTVTHIALKMTLQNKFKMSSKHITSLLNWVIIFSQCSHFSNITSWKFPNSTQNTLEYLDAAMSRSGLGWRNASAVAAASRNKADWLGRSSSDGDCLSAFSYRPVGGGSGSCLAGLPSRPSQPLAGQATALLARKQASLSGLCWWK
jgi:hypothetical protein